jgi:hypothetical protein
VINLIGKKVKIVILLFFVLITTILSTCYFVNRVAPVRFVKSYLNVRYGKTDYLNISERSNSQKNKIDTSLIGIDYNFSSFNSDIKHFIKYKLKASLINTDVYEVKRIQDIVSVKAKVNVSFKSDVMENWGQETFYDLNFFLKKQGFNRYVINYIKELDFQIKLKEDDKENHDHIH